MMPSQFLYHTPLGYTRRKMSHLENEKQKLLARIAEPKEDSTLAILNAALNAMT